MLYTLGHVRYTLHQGWR